MGDLQVCVWCAIVGNLAVDVSFGTSFINDAYAVIFPPERYVVPSAKWIVGYNQVFSNRTGTNLKRSAMVDYPVHLGLSTV